MYKFFKYSLPIGIAGIVLNLILYATNLYYELVIPIFENSGIEGAAFKFFDDLVFYSPFIYAGLFAAYLVAGQLYLKKHHLRKEEKVTEKLIEENAEIQKVLDEKAEFLRHDYYTNCPKCGAVREENKNVCSFCGASLIIDENTDKED